MKKFQLSLFTLLILLLTTLTPPNIVEASKVNSDAGATFFGTYDTSKGSTTQIETNDSRLPAQTNHHGVPILPRTGANHLNIIQRAGALLLVILGIIIRKGIRSENTNSTV